MILDLFPTSLKKSYQAFHVPESKVPKGKGTKFNILERSPSERGKGIKFKFKRRFLFQEKWEKLASKVPRGTGTKFKNDGRKTSHKRSISSFPYINRAVRGKGIKFKEFLWRGKGIDCKGSMSRGKGTKFRDLLVRSKGAKFVSSLVRGKGAKFKDSLRRRRGTRFKRRRGTRFKVPWYLLKDPRFKNLFRRGGNYNGSAIIDDIEYLPFSTYTGE
jgi:hypothetical protein